MKRQFHFNVKATVANNLLPYDTTLACISFSFSPTNRISSIFEFEQKRKLFKNLGMQMFGVNYQLLYDDQG